MYVYLCLFHSGEPAHKNSSTVRDELGSLDPFKIWWGMRVKNGFLKQSCDAMCAVCRLRTKCSSSISLLGSVHMSHDLLIFPFITTVRILFLIAAGMIRYKIRNIRRTQWSMTNTKMMTTNKILIMLHLSLILNTDVVMLYLMLVVFCTKNTRKAMKRRSETKHDVCFISSHLACTIIFSFMWKVETKHSGGWARTENISSPHKMNTRF